MPYAQGLPFAAGSHESHQAAVKASATRGEKTSAYLRFLSKHGARTDHEAAAYLRYPLSSINSIRNGAIVCGLVQKGAYAKPSPHGGNPCRVWELTDAGRAAVNA